MTSPGAPPGPIGPWGDPAADLPVLGRPLRQWQAAAAALPAGVPGSLACAPDLWVTPALSHAFARAAAAAGRPARLALRAGVQTDFSGALQDVEKQGDAWVFPMTWTPPGAPPGGPDDGAPLVVPDEARTMELPVQAALIPAGRVVLPLTGRCAVRITHWLHVLRANQLALLAHGHDLLHTRPLRLLGAVLRARSVDRHRVMACLTVRGRGCDVHPTAVVEASVLGDGARVGAHAVVRHSHLGDGAVVGDHAHVVSSVLGEGASVGRIGMLQGCVLFAGANTGHLGHQLCVVGRDAVIGGEVVLADYTPAAAGARVEVAGGGLAPAGTPLLGCAVGHRTRLMAGLYVAPGRSIPNDLTVLGPQAQVVRRLPDEAGRLAAGPDAVWTPDGEGGLRPIPRP